MTAVSEEKLDNLSTNDRNVVEDRRGYQEWTKSLPEGQFKRVITKLFSHEDGFQVHKTLGILSVVSFIYRYFWVYPTTGTLGFDGSNFDMCCMLVHLLLSTSSLIFHVLSHRIISRPMIIWEEYRLHAVVFSIRCFSVYLFGYFRPLEDSPYQGLLLGAIVLAHHLVVDEITRRYGSNDKSATTVRVKDDNNLLITIVLRFYAFYQFSALASYLAPNPRLMDIGFNAYVAIQSSAFLMTLYRKSLISYREHGIWYTFCLIVSIFHIFRMCGNTLFIFKLFTVYTLRVKFNINKYILWIGFVLMSLPFVEVAIKEFYNSHTQRNLDDELVTVTGQMLAQSLFFFGIRSDL